MIEEPIEIQVKRTFQLIDKELDKAYKDAVKFLAETLSAEVKSQPEDDSWYNQTGNLRSSVRSASFAKGVRQSIEDFVPLLPTATEAQSKSEGFITALTSECREGYVALVVAAMEYAGYVEAMDNKQVLAGVIARYRPVIDDIFNRYIDAAIMRINRS